ncbi:hypothetical protein DSO57_1019617 [Entomophthora muscae]|uniref:Uncharacterized protein n=1 Tax=Entomophthora muscae TaxID=34485 RepID=A0ACC2U324_9FUNG|nr:hypothetical protein DSO57_1019617 [Entomophthora muscae]
MSHFGIFLGCEVEANSGAAQADFLKENIDSMKDLGNCLSFLQKGICRDVYPVEAAYGGERVLHICCQHS